MSPAKVPAHGHSVTVEVSSKAYPDIKAEITVLIDRDESVRYKIGRENPDDVEAILYSNGDLRNIRKRKRPEFQIRFCAMEEIFCSTADLD